MKTPPLVSTRSIHQWSSADCARLAIRKEAANSRWRNFDDGPEIDSDPTEFGVGYCAAEAPETGLQAFGESNDSGRRMCRQVLDGGPIEGQ
jgi:hypothetical protein